MNKNLLVAATVISLFTLGASSTMAVPPGNVMSGRRYFMAAKDLTPWSAGVYFRSESRDADVDHVAETVESSRICLYAGYDVFSWLMPYIKIGSSAITLDGSGNDDRSPEFGFGARFNLLHHEIMDPTLIEDVLMVNASCEYSMTEATRNDDQQSYAEIYSMVTVSVLNEILGDKFYLPNGIALFLGPSYSIVETSGTSMNDNFGLVFGLDVFYSERVSFYLSGEMMGANSSSAMAGINISL